MNTWKLEECGLDLVNLRKQESLFAQGNGYFGWRGTFEEGAGDHSLEGCYINGFYESYPVKYPEIAYGYPEQGQAMLNVMNAKRIIVELAGEPVEMDPARIREYRRELDFRNGVLTRTFLFTTTGGQEVRIEVNRVISLPHKHYGAISLSVMSLNFSGDIRIRSALLTRTNNQSADKDPRVGTHLPQNCFESLSSGREGETFYAIQRTRRSRLSVACAAAHFVNSEAESAYRLDDDGLELSYSFPNIAAGQEVRLEKYIAYCAETRLQDVEFPLEIALKEAGEARRSGFAAIVAENEAYLQEFWNRTDIVIEGDDELQQGLRFNSFHLLQSAGRDGLRHVAAKGLTGEGYEGHYFWDTEIYVIPAFLYSSPEICRALLKYRFHSLSAARQRAREMGHPVGALFPWRTIGGSECSTFFPAGSAQYHINGDIALAIKNYVQVCDDRHFLEKYGAEILFETARLWMDLGTYSERKGSFCINCVTGPDEYTAVVNNNFYTNRVARENLWYAHRVYEQLKTESPVLLEELCEKIGLGSAEPMVWKQMADCMYFPYDEEKKVFLQDDSFADKARWDFAGTPTNRYPLLLHFHPLTIYRHQVLKQADTVLADFLLDQYVDQAQIRRDFDYYEPLTTHDSSLSACIYSIVACRIGYLDKAYDYFMRSARTDLDDHKGNTRDGVHIANMAGTSMCIINGFAGIRQREGRLLLRPVLPSKWKAYSFRINFRKRIIHISVSDGKTELTLLEGEPLTITCWDLDLNLKRGEAVIIEREMQI